MNDSDLNQELIGLILGWGKYEEAAKLAAEHGEYGVLLAMQAAYKDGYRQAVKNISKAAYNENPAKYIFTWAESDAMM